MSSDDGLSRPNVLPMVVRPIARLAPEQPEDGALLLRPRGRSKVGMSVLRAMGASDDIRLELDAYGAAVWGLIDGKRTVEEVGTHLRERFGEEMEPLYPRLAQFLLQLESRNAVELCPPASRG